MNQTPSLSGKVAVITGAAGAIGVVVSQLLASRGAVIYAVDLPGTDWQIFNRHMPEGSNIINLDADVTEEDSVAAYVERVRSDCGKIDIFFNNAGIEGQVKPLEDYSLDVFSRVMQVNVIGVFLGLKYVLPVMYAAGCGSIINTSSVAGLIGAPGGAAYHASKHAVLGLTRVAAIEAGPRGVRVNCVNPGAIESRMMQSINQGQSPDKDAARAVISALIPAGRYGQPHEVAGLVAFLAGDESTYCNGGFYTADGGLTAC